MDLNQLDKDRFLRKDPDQTDQTKGAVYASVNPAPKKGDDSTRKIGQAKDSEEDDGAPNVLTGTVITSCFIQTSALPSRIELQGNDLTFFDDTYTQAGKVIGDTSRLIFTHGSGKKGEVITAGFILEKRASVFNTYDNVLSWYSPPPPNGAHDYMFIGRNAYSQDEERNISSIHFAVNGETNFTPIAGNPPLNGVFEVEYSDDTVFKQRLLYMGKSDALLPGNGLTGYSSFMIAGEGGVVGLAYTSGASLAIALYMLNDHSVMLGADLIPDTNAAYDIGSPSFKIGTLYGSVVACPLPTVENALELLDKIPAPTSVGDRGHYGDDKKYFDDLTFPAELLFTDKKGRTDIEHNHVLGFLLKAVIELKGKVDYLEGRLT